MRIVDRVRLEEFKRIWRYHHPLADEQMPYSGSTAHVDSVSFYHGGDELYTLYGIPGIWHESCLFSEDAEE